RVAGPLAVAAEVEHARYDRLAEVPQPDVVHGHAGGERVVPFGDPAGESEPAAGTRLGIGDGGPLRIAGTPLLGGRRPLDGRSLHKVADFLGRLPRPRGRSLQ